MELSILVDISKKKMNKDSEYIFTKYLSFQNLKALIGIIYLISAYLQNIIQLCIWLFHVCPNLALWDIHIFVKNDC